MVMPGLAWPSRPAMVRTGDALGGEGGGGEVAEGVEGDVGQLKPVSDRPEGTRHPIGAMGAGGIEVL